MNEHAFCFYSHLCLLILRFNDKSTLTAYFLLLTLNLLRSHVPMRQRVLYVLTSKSSVCINICLCLCWMCWWVLLCVAVGWCSSETCERVCRRTSCMSSVWERPSEWESKEEEGGLMHILSEWACCWESGSCVWEYSKDGAADERDNEIETSGTELEGERVFFDRGCGFCTDKDSQRAQLCVRGGVWIRLNRKDLQGATIGLSVWSRSNYVSATWVTYEALCLLLACACVKKRTRTVSVLGTYVLSCVCNAGLAVIPPVLCVCG